jgi:hypothetical protein
MPDETTEAPSPTTSAAPRQRNADLASSVEYASRPAADAIASGRGRRHGTSYVNAFDRWFRYPAGFATDYASALLERLHVPENGAVLDCFAGSGVIGTAAQQLGLRFYGIEAHPLIAELARLKLQPAPKTDISLGETSKQLAEAATSLIRDRLERGAPSAPDQADLVKRCFDPEHLEALVALRDLIKEGHGEHWSPYLKWALLGCLRELASAKVGWPYQRPSQQRKPMFSAPIKRFLARAEQIESDIAGHSSTGNSGIVVTGDARDPASWKIVEPASIEGCVSSPPYLNNFDYADATRLELYFWGDVTSWAQMCLDVRSGMITATTQQSSVGAARDAIERLNESVEVRREVAEINRRLENERKSRKRGKEYDRVVPDYFAGILQVLENLAEAMSPKARCAWLIGDSAPYGVYVDTPRLIGMLAKQAGFTVESDELLRHRGQRWAANAMKHDVKLSERLLILRR